MQTKTTALAAILCVALTGCAHSAANLAPAAAPPETTGIRYGQEGLQGVLWVQTAVEFRGAARQAYAAARHSLDAALDDSSWNALPDLPSTTQGTLPPAIILDIDETCIDNSSYQAKLARTGESYTEASFEEHIRSGSVTAMPGAVEFLRYAAWRGVTIFYVTNQRAAAEEATRVNLQKVGLPVEVFPDTVLTVGEQADWTSDKSSRRAHIAERYRVVLLFGDDFNDFVSANGKSLAERRELFDRHADRFGVQWFLLPNPMYGSWDRAVVAASGKSAEERFKARFDALRTSESE